MKVRVTCRRACIDLCVACSVEGRQGLEKEGGEGKIRDETKNDEQE